MQERTLITAAQAGLILGKNRFQIFRMAKAGKLQVAEKIDRGDGKNITLFDLAYIRLMKQKLDSADSPLIISNENLELTHG